MAEDTNNHYQGQFKSGSAAAQPISLSQALLAPLDAIFKAQIHAARSFLNLILQIGYPHVPLKDDGSRIPHEDSRAYSQDFYYDAQVDGKTEPHKVSIPALALVPVTPLAIESADIKLELNVSHVFQHRQIQESEGQSLSQEYGGFRQEHRPWFLVPDPISIHGTLAPTGGDKQSQAAIQIEIKIGKSPMPAGLDKLLTHLTQASQESVVSSKAEHDQQTGGNA